MTRRVLVVTEFINPPIPNRKADWRATLDGYEPGDPSGYGETEDEAVADLYIAIAEREAEDEERVS